MKEQAIYTTGAGPYPSWLRSEKPYENFVLRFEYQTQGWYEGGVLLHAPWDGPGSRLGFKIHLRHDRDDYGVRSPGAIYDVAAPRRLVNLPSGQWNHCEVECNWPLLRVTLNGTVLHEINMDANDVLKYRLRKGYLGLQNIGCRAYFRNIQIRPLPDQEHWTRLLESGMEGFRVSGKANWQIQDDTLTGQVRMDRPPRSSNSKAPSSCRCGSKRLSTATGAYSSTAAGRALKCNASMRRTVRTPPAVSMGLCPLGALSAEMRSGSCCKYSPMGRRSCPGQRRSRRRDGQAQTSL